MSKKEKEKIIEEMSSMISKLNSKNLKLARNYIYYKLQAQKK